MTRARACILAAGLRDRRYLDKTGLGRHRGIAAVMRYAAINPTLDVLGNSGGFVPAAADGRTLAPPGQGECNGAVRPLLGRANIRAGSVHLQLAAADQFESAPGSTASLRYHLSFIVS